MAETAVITLPIYSPLRITAALEEVDVRRFTFLGLVFAAGLTLVASDDTARADFWSDTGHAIKEDAHDAGTTIRRTAHQAGHAIKRGLHATGHAVKQAGHETGHAIENGLHNID
jgi:hypothetical protein